MRSKRWQAYAVPTLAIAASLGCSGKLEVGEDADTSGTGGSSSVGVGGGVNHNAAGGAGGSGGVGTPTTSMGSVTTGSISSSGGVGSDGSVGSGGISTSAGGATSTNTQGTNTQAAATTGTGGSSGSWLDEIEPVDPVEGSSDGCPTGPIEPDSGCDARGLVCGYLYSASEYESCTCTASVSGQRWRCQFFSGEQLDLCPSEVPETGEDCYGLNGLNCPFLTGAECSCDEVWYCIGGETTELPEAPASAQSATGITSLDDGTRSEWCDWYSQIVRGPGGPPLPDQPVGEDGVISNSACYYELERCEVALPGISQAQCVANLALSECEAPVSTLTACVQEMFSNICGLGDEGCADLFAVEGCDGTMVVHTQAPSSCGVRVE